MERQQTRSKNDNGFAPSQPPYVPRSTVQRRDRGSNSFKCGKRGIRIGYRWSAHTAPGTPSRRKGACFCAKKATATRGGSFHRIADFARRCSTVRFFGGLSRSSRQNHGKGAAHARGAFHGDRAAA